MTMKNMFSTKLYLQGLRKIRTAGVAMSIVITVLNAWIPIQCITTKSAPEYGATSVLTEVEAGMFAPFGFLLLFFAPLLVYNMFSFLNDRKSSDFFHSLPQKRICIYNSFIAAILTWVLSTLLLSTLVNTVLWAMADAYVLVMKAVVLNVISFIILSLVMMGFMMLAMTVTGTAVANCLVFVLFFLFIRACGMFFLYGFAEITAMFHIEYSWLKVFNIQFFLPVGILSQIFDGDAAVFESAGFFLYWFAVAAVLFALSALMYCRRRSESATKSAPNRFMQNLYRIGVTFPFLMLGAYLIMMDEDIYLFLLCAFVAFLVWVIFELLTTKKVKNVIRSLPLLLVPVLLAGGYMASVHLARNAFYAFTPDRESIESVKLSRLTSSYASNFFSSYHSMVGDIESAILYATEITDEAAIDKVFEAIEQTKKAKDWSQQEYEDNGYYFRQSVTLTLRSGRRVTYNLRSTVDIREVLSSTKEFDESKEFIYNGNVVRFGGLRIDDPQTEEVWALLKEEFGAMTAQQQEEYQKISNKYWPSSFFLNVYGNYEGVSFTQSYVLHPQYTPRALSLYMKYYDANNQTLESLALAKDQAMSAKADEVQYVCLQIESYPDPNEASFVCLDFEKVKEFLTYLSVDSHLTDYDNAKKVYRFRLSLEVIFPEAVPNGAKGKMPEDAVIHTTTQNEQYLEKFYGYISDDLYVTLSDSDILKLEQILVKDSEN